MKKALILLTVLLMFSMMPGMANADSITFNGSSGSLAASAIFDLTGSTLTITLTNTSTADVLVPMDVLMGLFFNTTNKLTPVSASLNGSSVYYASIVKNVGEGWQYKSEVSAQGENSGISATGLGIFGPDGNFYSPGVKLDGIDYGILSAGDDTTTDNGGISSGGPLFKNSLQFTLTAASGFDLSELGNTVVFQYGTDLTEPNFTGTPAVPEPATLLLMAFGSGVMGGGIKRLRKKFKK
jgi:hypothetical protein